MTGKNKEIPAVRLMNGLNGESFFEKGVICSEYNIKSEEFWFANDIDSWQIGSHTAPRKQFVITLSGKLKFTTSDNLSFILEPGIVLLAEDIAGKGHRWEMIEGHEIWQRIYIPFMDDSVDFFIKI